MEYNLSSNEKTKLLESPHLYGSISRSDGKESKDKQTRYGLAGLFRYASKVDFLLMLGGTLCAIIVGSAGPVLGLVFGSMTNAFTRASKYGFVEDSSNSNFSYLDDNTPSATITLSYVDASPVPKDLFMSQMNTFSLYYLFIGIAVLVSEYLEIWQWELACERQVFKLRKIFFSQVLRQDVEWFDTNDYGDLASKLSDDLERVREGLGHKFAISIQYLSTLVTGLAVGFYANWRLTCVLIAVAPLVGGSSAYMARTLSGGAAREQLRYSYASKVAEETLTCLRTVAAFGGEKLEMKRYDEAIEKGKRETMKKYYLISFSMCFVLFVTYSTYGLAFWYSATLVMNGTATIGSVFTVFFAVLTGALGIGPLLPYINSVFTAIGSSEVILDIIDRRPHIDPYSDSGIKPEKLTGKIEFRDVRFTYPTRRRVQVISGLNFVVEPGQTVAFIGSSGAGKSTIVNLLMRFYDVTHGEILLDGRDIRTLNLKWLRQNIGIVSQEPVLFGVSIADNIRYGREGVSMEDIIRASTVANAHIFIKDLPEGYDTQVGDRGTQLSGGQKQRIAIARALVRDPKILLLDEATSALDAKSESIVQDALDAAKKGRTTFIIAHRLSTIKDSDTIFAMKDGKAVESGTHKELMKMKGLYYDLVKMQKKEEKNKQDKEKEDEYEITLDRLSLGTPRTSIAESTKGKKSSQSVVWRILKINLPEWRYLTLGFVNCGIEGVITPVFAFLYAQVFTTFQLSNDELMKVVPIWTSVFVGLGVVSGINMAFRIMSMSYGVEQLLGRMRTLCFSNIIKQQPSWFDDEDNSIGTLSTLLAREAPIIKSCSGLRVGQLVSSGFTLIAALGIAVVYGWKLALILALCVPVLVYTGYKQASSLRQSLIINNEGMTLSGKIASEGVQQVKTVQSLGSQEMFLNVYAAALEEPYRENKKQALWLALTCAIAYAIPYLVYAAAFKLGSYLIIIHEMTPADVYRVFFALSMSASTIGGSAAYYQDLGKGKAAADAMLKIMDRKSDADPTSDDGVEHEAKGNISFENIHFSYPMRPDVKILQGLNLTVSAGETVALVGESGCGKSTIISLLERFYTPSSGKIKLDGVDLEKIKLSSLRKQMGIVTQEPVLFCGTIKSNITYGAIDREVTDNEIIEAAKLANIHDFICSLPLGYETPCGERGTQLSGGQKQRIAIARALLRNPKILLLDEATSALDVESEKVVQLALDRAREGRTSLVVSHRLSTVQNADKIVVIQKGVVVESGNHHELMAHQGFYSQLVQKQQM
uniref:Multidrug resistance protein 1 n=2 Tax=Lygus hesperus TaxID=30085 RepID=A0A146L3B6_LYGHE